MIFSLKKKLALTLAEVMIVFVVISIVATIISGFIRQKSYDSLNKHMGYAAFTNLQNIIAELVVEGCTAADRLDPPLDCTATSILPVVGHNNTTKRGLCDRITDSINGSLNTIGSIDCTQTAADGTVSTATPNFIATNGMRFFNFGTNSDTISKLFTIYIDIDGTRRSAKLNTDIMKFTINTETGQVLPDLNSKIATSTGYLSAGVGYRDSSGNYVWVKQSATYRSAVCGAKVVTDATYCSGYPVYANCDYPTAGNYQCEVTLNNPKDL